MILIKFIIQINIDTLKIFFIINFVYNFIFFSIFSAFVRFVINLLTLNSSWYCRFLKHHFLNFSFDFGYEFCLKKFFILLFAVNVINSLLNLKSQCIQNQRQRFKFRFLFNNVFSILKVFDMFVY